MPSQAATVWTAPRWLMSVMLAGLAMLGPFAVDTYLPAFAGISQALGATPVQMQQTLSAYLFAFGVMNLFHGALSDSVGRRPVILAGVAVFTLASVGCALSDSIGALVFWRAMQGAATGAGAVVSRAVIRDLYPPHEAQRVMSQVTIFFGLAPAIAPIIGGWLFVHAGWRTVFWFLVAVGVVLGLGIARGLPESLQASQRQAFDLRNLMRGYALLLGDARFLLLCLASGVPFNGMFLYVLSAPVYLGEVLGLAPTQFFWFFLLNIAGIMAGAWLSGRLAGRSTARRQIRLGYGVMLVVSLLNVAANMLWTAEAWWAMWPIAVFSFGWSLMMPAVTLMVLDLHPARRGMASSLQASVGAGANALVAGVISPWVMHSAVQLSWASLALMGVGLLAWLRVQRRVSPAAASR